MSDTHGVAGRIAKAVAKALRRERAAKEWERLEAWRTGLAERRMSMGRAARDRRNSKEKKMARKAAARKTDNRAT